MNPAVRRAFVYDAGALIAAERDDNELGVRHARAVRRNRRPLVPTPVLTQVWRGGARQARLSMVLHGCDIEPTSEQIARAAGVLLSHSGTADAVDAIVVATAAELHAVVVTSDPIDLRRIAEAAPKALPIDFIEV